MSPNPFGNRSSKKDRASCKRLFNRANRLREVAELLEQSAKALDEIPSGYMDIEGLPSTCERYLARWKFRGKADRLEREALEKAKKALRQAEEHLSP